MEHKAYYGPDNYVKVWKKGFMFHLAIGPPDHRHERKFQPILQAI